MRDLHLASGLMVAAVMASGAMAQGVHQSRNEHAAVGPVPSVQPLTNAFTDAHPQTRLLAKGDRIVRVYGRAFSTGATASASALAFIANHASMFGAEPADLIPVGPFPDGRHVQPIMFDAASGTYKFTGLYYTQTKAGIPVYGSRLTLLVRNEPGFPLVLAGAEMHDLDGFDATVQDKALLAPEVVTALASRFFARQPGITAPELVIWAGLDGADAEPRLAYALTGRSEDPFDVEMPEMLDLVLDAMSGELLYMEDGIVEVDIPGTVAGVSNVDEGAFFCSPLAAQGLPYARVTAGLNQTYAAADGGFVLGYGGSLPVTVNATLTGPYFFVNNIAGPNTTASITYSDGVANLNFNGIPSDEITAQVNAYLQANIVRDFALAHNPAYPVVSTQTDFPVYVNRTGGICPGNAWYDSGAFAINFCSAGGGYPNTAYWKIVHHEYGHHLVNVGGSGQGMYGEGMGDTIGVCISDTPELALGFFGDCNEPLRNADNTLQYPCSGEIHFCGQLIAGAVWDTRNELIVTEPDDYLDILSNLTVNSILLHNGNSIDPSITIDFLTLDDDNGDILDGTPHYSEIAAGFGAHNLDAPALALIGIEFPDGRPDLIGTGGTIVRVEAVGIAGTPVPGTGRLHYDAGNGPVVVDMTEVEANVYDAAMPGGDCGDVIEYFFTVEAVGNGDQTWPPSGDYDAIIGTSSELIFKDTFETNLGWGVSGDAGDGQWNRGVPVGGGDRGDPPTDADGSGQCYLTDNVDGNSDVDGGTTTLTSPVMNASAVTDGEPFVSYWRWYSNTAGDSPMADIFVVDVSDDGGTTWTTLETVGPAGAEVDGGWFNRQFRVADYVDVTSQFRIRFSASDLGAGSVVEAGVDGVELVGIVCTDEGVFGDLDGDGSVGPADLAILLANWGSAGAGDLDDSGTVDAADLAILLSVWTG